MNRPLDDDGNPIKSKYDQKLADIRSGKREPFQFIDRPERIERVSAPPPPITRKDLDRGVVRTRVVKTLFYKGCLFLKTETGLGIFLGLSTLDQYYNDATAVRAGDVIDGMIEPHPNGKGPRMWMVTSITLTLRAVL